MVQSAENRYCARRLADDLWAVEEAGVRCFLVCGKGEAMLIDACASGGAEFDETVRYVAGGATLRVVLTHADYDHFAGVSPNDSPLLHPSEFDRYRSARPLPADGSGRLRAVREGDVLACGGRRLEVIHIPGHTPGSIALLDAENRCIFAGDSVSLSHVYMFGEGRNIEAYIDSLARLEAAAGRFDRFYCAHGEAELPVSQLAAQRRGAEKLLNGELEGTEPPQKVKGEAMLYRYGSAAFLY